MSDLLARADEIEDSATTLFTHHHYGWRRHDLPNSHQDHLMTALMETHEFLKDFAGSFRVDIQRTPCCSFDGVVSVYWSSVVSGPRGYFGPLKSGDFWFEAFRFNQAPQFACRYCGGTGIDHYSGPFFHCWACDGSGTQIRASRPRDQKLKLVAIHQGRSK